MAIKLQSTNLDFEAIGVFIYKVGWLQQQCNSNAFKHSEPTYPTTIWYCTINLISSVLYNHDLDRRFTANIHIIGGKSRWYVKRCNHMIVCILVYMSIDMHYIIVIIIYHKPAICSPFLLFHDDMTVWPALAACASRKSCPSPGSDEDFQHMNDINIPGLVNIQKTIENGHTNSWFSQLQHGDFP